MVDDERMFLPMHAGIFTNADHLIRVSSDRVVPPPYTEVSTHRGALECHEPTHNWVYRYLAGDGRTSDSGWCLGYRGPHGYGPASYGNTSGGAGCPPAD